MTACASLPPCPAAPVSMLPASSTTSWCGAWSAAPSFGMTAIGPSSPAGWPPWPPAGPSPCMPGPSCQIMAICSSPPAPPPPPPASPPSSPPAPRPLARSRRALLPGSAGAFTRRHHRVGHLFQNRYKSIVVEAEPYLLELVRYLHLNPLRAQVVPTLRALDR